MRVGLKGSICLGICEIKGFGYKTRGQALFDYRPKGGRKERQPLLSDLKDAIDEYLEADRQNRRETKTGDENTFLFQADIPEEFPDRASLGSIKWYNSIESFPLFG